MNISPADVGKVKEAPQIYVVASQTTTGNVAYVTYREDHGTYGITSSVTNASTFNLLRANEVQTHANKSLQKDLSDYDRFAVISLKPKSK